MITAAQAKLVRRRAGPGHLPSGPCVRYDTARRRPWVTHVSCSTSVAGNPSAGPKPRALCTGGRQNQSTGGGAGVLMPGWRMPVVNPPPP